VFAEFLAGRLLAYLLFGLAAAWAGVALEKLAARNLSDPNPSRLVEALFYTHPPVAKRIAYILQSAQKLG
jgi:Zn-dependent protease with chaperone function